MMTELTLHEWVFHIVKFELLYNTNVYFVGIIQHSFSAVQYFSVDYIEYSFIATAMTAKLV
jgi:hypothetical protein